ncbi:MAG TPA: phosphatase PAP2 family protein [Verrucomicrobiae bacterium]|jgi:membrane-associated phospholipid phosphatase|nr:phosphatase PAP2 family protein [Verrucomicrobiae bacterium]
MPELFYRLPQNVLAIFRGRNLWWHALAIVLTIGIVLSGGDWAYYRATRGDIFLQLAWPGIRVGTYLLVMGTLLLLVAGLIGKSRRLITTGWALGQAALLGYLISCAYKAFTGRLPPPRLWRMKIPMTGVEMDSSHGFQFGFLRGGIFWGWPSSHTTIAFAMMLCLVAMYPKNRWLMVGALLYALYVGLAVSVTIHWLSEFVAGAIIGSVIGIVVGKSFRGRVESHAPVAKDA